ncbi:unnamed protein product [Paramecium octaurelia]|uniref:Uncharacterized protein n=1 Tax=Paramecium octaurelia TaxID=43137 RepID=A0A8S1XNM3_PAROT|nr:unnamed protein product [Paramecium octaurelia]
MCQLIEQQKFYDCYREQFKQLKAERKSRSQKQQRNSLNNKEKQKKDLVLRTPNLIKSILEHSNIQQKRWVYIQYIKNTHLINTIIECLSNHQLIIFDLRTKRRQSLFLFSRYQQDIQQIKIIINSALNCIKNQRIVKYSTGIFNYQFFQQQI